MKGYLYVLFNDVYKMYGEHVYKLGRTINEINRMRSYTTPFKDKSKYLYVSEQFDNCVHAERVLFWLLRHRRIKKEREFFDITLDGAINIIKRLESLDKKVISILYERILHSICPEQLVERVLNGEEMLDSEYDEKIKDPFEYLERFRFRPKNPSMYPNWVPPEEYNLNKLLFPKTNCDSDSDTELETTKQVSQNNIESENCKISTDNEVCQPESFVTDPHLHCKDDVIDLSVEFKNKVSMNDNVIIELIPEVANESLVPKPKRKSSTKTPKIKRSTQPTDREPDVSVVTKSLKRVKLNDPEDSTDVEYRPRQGSGVCKIEEF